MSKNITKHGVIIDEKIFKNGDGDNINGPCLIKLPDFIQNRLGKYYLYFAHHCGQYIRMAYSDDILGPYKLYQAGVLNVSNTPGFEHIASPDVVIDEDNKQIIMYYHCPYNNGKTPQSTFSAFSNDGLNFISNNVNILYPYFRYIKYENEEYGIAMHKPTSVILKKNKYDCNYAYIASILPHSRHTHTIQINGKLYVFFSMVGDCPEHILFAEIITLSHNDNIVISKYKSIIKPEFDYEHNLLIAYPSKYGKVVNKINQLRDPYVYIENDIVYILYTVCGENGIAICSTSTSYFT
jgi:hypothetical protein